MSISSIACPLCGMSAGEWTAPDGQVMATCHHMNQPQHPGRRHTWNKRTGEPFRPADPEQLKINMVFQKGQPRDMRGYSAEFLSKTCQIVWITAIELSAIFGNEHGIYDWGKECERDGHFIAALPLRCGTKVTGIQFRSFPAQAANADEGVE